MSWQTPGKDGPPEPTEPSEPSAAPAPPSWPSPDAETTRVPVPGDEPVSPPPPAAGLISAKPVGWTDPNATQPQGGPSPTDPAVAWAPPVQAARPAAQVVDGLVIAGTFSRVVGWFIDILFLGLVNIAAAGLLSLVVDGGDDVFSLALGIAFVVVDALYFIGLWTSGWHATLGMRLLRLRVLNATTAGTLSLNDALLRWIALSGAIAILALIPRLAGTVGFASVLWLIALLISTAIHPLHQGLHDRWARSVVVQPAPGGSGAAVVGCILLAVVLFIVLPLAFIVVAGPQLEDILLQIGESI